MITPVLPESYKPSKVNLFVLYIAQFLTEPKTFIDHLSPSTQPLLFMTPFIMDSWSVDVFPIVMRYNNRVLIWSWLTLALSLVRRGHATLSFFFLRRRLTVRSYALSLESCADNIISLDYHENTYGYRLCWRWELVWLLC